MRVVPVFTLETNNQRNNECLPKFVQTNNASSNVKTANGCGIIMTANKATLNCIYTLCLGIRIHSILNERVRPSVLNSFFWLFVSALGWEIWILIIISGYLWFPTNLSENTSRGRIKMKNGKICVRVLCSIDNPPRKTQLEMFYHPWLLCMDCKVSAIFIQSTYSKFYLAI